jgi:catechol 2,3-dioxygenase-like lactoylglutathione lyase family enzyme
MTEFPATAHHVGLTVTDLEVSRQWYQRLLNAAPVLDEEVPSAPSRHQGFHKAAGRLPTWAGRAPGHRPEPSLQ